MLIGIGNLRESGFNRFVFFTENKDLFNGSVEDTCNLMGEENGRIVLTFLKGNNSPGRYGNAVGKLLLSHAAFVSEFPDEIVHSSFRILDGMSD